MHLNERCSEANYYGAKDVKAAEQPVCRGCWFFLIKSTTAAAAAAAAVSKRTGGGKGNRQNSHQKATKLERTQRALLALQL